MAKKRGYFILYRDIYSSPVFKNLLQASCWIYFISSASHQDKTLKFLGSEVFRSESEKQPVWMISPPIVLILKSANLCDLRKIDIYKSIGASKTSKEIEKY